MCVCLRERERERLSLSDSESVCEQVYVVYVCICMFDLGAGCLMECNRKMYIMERCLQGRLCRKRGVLCNKL